MSPLEAEGEEIQGCAGMSTPRTHLLNQESGYYFHFCFELFLTLEMVMWQKGEQVHVNNGIHMCFVLKTYKS